MFDSHRVATSIVELRRGAEGHVVIAACLCRSPGVSASTASPHLKRRNLGRTQTMAETCWLLYPKNLPSEYQRPVVVFCSLGRLAAITYRYFQGPHKNVLLVKHQREAGIMHSPDAHCDLWYCQKFALVFHYTCAVVGSPGLRSMWLTWFCREI